MLTFEGVQVQGANAIIERLQVWKLFTSIFV